MIARIPHPTQPGEHLYRPMRFDLDRGAWVPILLPGAANGTYPDHAAAVAACMAHLMDLWQHFQDEVAVLRALCEHPNFECDNDGIDDRMIRKRAQSLDARTVLLDQTLRRLLDAPEPADHLE